MNISIIPYSAGITYNVKVSNGKESVVTKNDSSSVELSYSPNLTFELLETAGYVGIIIGGIKEYTLTTSSPITVDVDTSTWYLIPTLLLKRDINYGFLSTTAAAPSG